MTDVKASIEWARQQAHIWRQRGDQAGSAYMVRHYTTLADAAAEPRLPKEPEIPALIAMDNAIPGPTQYDNLRLAYRALYAHLERPHVDFAALDEARMEPEPCVDQAKLREAIEWTRANCNPLNDHWGKRLPLICDAAEAMLNHGRGSKAAGGKPQRYDSEPHNCTPAARDELRAAISVLRGWSAEAAGRTGLQPAVRMVCNAAEATLPVQFYRIRAKGLDVVHAGPVSISEVEE